MKAPRELIAYQGPAFTIEWYFDPRGKSTALDYFETLTADQQDRLLLLLKRMGDFGKILDRTKFRSEGDKIFAFKPQPDRFLCFFVAGRKIVITNAFRKKSDRLPPGEKRRALLAMDSYLERVTAGRYYEAY